jgi:acyl dehydratase
MPAEERSEFRIASVSAQAMATLAVLHRDPNAIHLDAEAAAAAGLGDRVVNPGAANLGYVLNALAILAPTGRIEQLGVAFRTNVFAEDEVIATAAVQHSDLTEDATRLHCHLALDVASGVRALGGTATVAVPAVSQSGSDPS